MPQDPEDLQQRQEQVQQNLRELFDDVNQQFVDAAEENVEAQTAFVQTWLDTIADASGDARSDDALEGYRRAYETWMSAAEETLEALEDAEEGEDVPITQFRDLWLSAANRSFKEVMSTAAFASASGETVDDLLELKRRRDEVTEDTLHEFGLATKGDVREVGERLVELERRLHEVDQRIERVLDELDG